MKIAIMGSGGVGGYYGGRLALAGHSVAFVARGAHAAALRANGLTLRTDGETAVVRPAAVFEDPRLIGEADLILVAVKLWDTAAAAKAIAPLVSERTSVLSLQNGIDKDDELARTLDRRRLLGGVTYINAAIGEPGVIVKHGKVQRIVLGELDGAPSPRCESIAQALREAGIDAQASADIRRSIWEKFVFLSAHSGVTALTRRPIGQVREHPATRALLLDAMREGVAVASAEGLALPDGFAEERLAFVDSLAADSSSSMALDLEKGHRLELEWLSGALLRRAERHRLSVPNHRAVYAGLVLHAQGAIAQ